MLDNLSRHALVDPLNAQTVSLPPPLAGELADAQDAWRPNENTRRLGSKEASLWTCRDENNWLGWLDIVGAELRDAATLREFGRELCETGFDDVLLLGMGGRRAILDCTCSIPPIPIMRRFERGHDIARTIFIVASKSGTTLEPSVLMDYIGSPQ